MRKRSENQDLGEVAEVPTGLSRQSERVLNLIQIAAGFYFGVAALVVAYMIFWMVLVVNGAPAISLPIGRSSVTEVPSLALPPGIDGAHFTEASISARDLSTTASLLYYAPGVLLPMAHSLIAFAIHKLALSAASARPFGRSARRALTLSGVTIAVIGTATQLLHGFGVDLARHELLSDSQLYTGSAPSTPFDWSPLFIGLAIYVVAVIFSTGERFQKETDGLI